MVTSSADTGSSATTNSGPRTIARAIAMRCFDEGILIRSSGDTLVLSPPLIIAENEIEIVFGHSSYARQARLSAFERCISGAELVVEKSVLNLRRYARKRRSY